MGSDSRTLQIRVKHQKVRYSQQVNNVDFGDGAIQNVTRARDGTLLIFSDGQIMKGKPGHRFTQINPDAHINSWNTAIIHPHDSSQIFSATTGILYLSFDGGRSWDEDSYRALGSNLDIQSLAISQANPDLLYVGLAGRTYILNTADPERSRQNDLDTETILHFTDNRDYVAAANENEIFIAQQGNNLNWDIAPSANWGNINQLYIHGNQIFVAAQNGLYLSSLHPMAWQKVRGIDGPVKSVLIQNENPPFPQIENPGRQTIIYGGTENGLKRGVMVQQRSPQTWQTLGNKEINWMFGGDPIMAVTEDAFYTVTSTLDLEAQCTP
jgi:hypothetical protein